MNTIVGKITVKEEKATQDDKPYQKYKVEVNGKELSISDWKANNLKLNKTYELNVEEKDGEYQGQPITYRNLITSKLLEDGIAKIHDEFQQANQVKKEPISNNTSIVRQSSLKVAIEIIKLRYQNKLVENQDTTQETLEEAEIFEKWCNR